MEAVRHFAQMRVRADDGSPVGAHLAKAARAGRAEAVAALEGPPVPEELEYLFEWALELDAVRHYDMNGPQLVTYAEVEAWARLTDRRPAPHEVRGLLVLDRVLAHPDVPKETK